MVLAMSATRMFAVGLYLGLRKVKICASSPDCKYKTSELQTLAILPSWCGAPPLLSSTCWNFCMGGLWFQHNQIFQNYAEDSFQQLALSDALVVYLQVLAKFTLSSAQILQFSVEVSLDKL